MLDYIVYIVSALPISMMIISFINLNLGLALYVLYRVCVPYLNIHLFGLTLGYNLLHAFFFLAFLLDLIKNNKRIGFKEVSPFILYFCLTFLMMFLQNRISFGEQFGLWYREALLTIIIPIIIFNKAKYDERLIGYLKWALVFALLFSGIYGLYLMTQPAGYNPYLTVMALLNGEEYKIDYADDGNRALPRIFSTFSHPLNWCLFLTFFIVCFWNYKQKTNRFLFWFLMTLALVNLLFCGVRTGIVALSVAIVYYIWKQKRMAYFSYLFFILCIVLVVIRSNEILYDYFYSIVDSSATDTKGSNIDMRLVQWEGCVEECEGRELVGNGYRWTEYYGLKFGNHPKAVTFESLIFVIYTNWGILGFVIWGLMFYRIYSNNNKFRKRKISPDELNTLLLLYIVFSTLTGEYYYMRWFALFYSIIFIIKKDMVKTIAVKRIKAC